jgi:hypothetical protein
MLAVSTVDGLHRLDLTDPLHPREIGSFGGGRVEDITVIGSRLYGRGTTYYHPERGYDQPTVWVLDVTDPAAPLELGHAYVDAWDLAVVENVVLVAGADYGLQVLEVTTGPLPPTRTPGPSPTRPPSPTPTAAATGVPHVTLTASLGGQSVYLPLARTHISP